MPNAADLAELHKFDRKSFELGALGAAGRDLKVGGILDALGGRPY